MTHKIKLRKPERTEPVCCPYNDRGLCHRNGCIFKPAMTCMNYREYKDAMDAYYKYRKEKEHANQRTKNY